MELDKLSKSIRFGIPHSKFIDKILTLRDSSINIEYFSFYKEVLIKHQVSNQNIFNPYSPTGGINSLRLGAIANHVGAIASNVRAYTNMFSGCTSLSTPSLLNEVVSDYFFPIFSFESHIYSLVKNIDVTGSCRISALPKENYLEHPDNFIKEDPPESYEKNLSLTVSEFESLLLTVLKNNDNLIRYFIKK